MHLKSVKLAGFKSFVDPTTIPIRGNMNAIVGPNGCGKSNVVDAIRWVIGEGSAKKLRGQSMSDVIFNGTSGRKPVGRAMVELHFDNTDGRVTGEYAKYSEIVIRREVERDGQSNYFLNGSGCRRRDILDIFLGTGLGPRSYSIIEQGMISNLIEAKPEDLRSHLEEVAGISKYKERRRETETRIRHTQENLDRLNDLLEELDKQLRHLKRQATAAERYQEYKAEERVLSAQIKALHWKELENKLTSFQGRVQAQEVEREKIIADKREIEATMEKTRSELVDSTEQYNDVQKRFYSFAADIARLEQQIKHHQEQSHRWQQELKEAQTLEQELSENAVEYQEQIRELESDLSALNPQQDSVRIEVQEANQALNIAQNAMQQSQAEWDAFQDHHTTITSQIEVLRTKRVHYEQRLAEYERRAQQLADELLSLDLAELEKSLSPLQIEKEQLSNEFSEMQNALTEKNKAINAQRENNNGTDVALQAAQSQLQTLKGRESSLQALQEAALNPDEGLSAWINRHELNGKSRLAKSMQVSAGWEKAVETVLAGYFDAVCVDSIEDFINSATELSEGNLTLINARSQPQSPVSLHHLPLSNLIQTTLPLTQWTQGIYAVDTLDQAKAIRTQLADHESVITKEGVWLGKTWLRVSKKSDPQTGVLLREQQLTQIKNEIDALTNTVNAVLMQQQSGRATLVELESEREALHQATQALNKKVTGIQSELTAKETRMQQMRERKMVVQKSLEDCREKTRQLEAEQVQAEKNFQTFSEDAENASAKRDTLLANRQHSREALEQARMRAQQKRQQQDELGLRIAASENQLKLLNQTVLRDDKQLTQITERREHLESQLFDTQSPLENFNHQLQEQLNKRLLIEEELKSAETVVSNLNHQLQELDQNREAKSEEIAAVENKLQTLRMERQEIVVRQATIKEQLEQSGEQLNAIVENLPQEANLNQWEVNLEHLQKRIDRLGPINLAAIDEYKSAEERKEYLDKQHADLREALEVLQTAIAKIDKETKNRFRETFEKVNEGFQKNFPRIFGGGKAYLELSDTDLLTTGIYVKAQPPGKRNSTIHMLSGGEKALTAIALVFSMFQLNPAPFCILDEVDAPLDDLNVGRFCHLVREMSKETQFLVISHNKVTIGMADYLMGVTMQEAGVSRLVAVDMEEAIEMVEA